MPYYCFDHCDKSKLPELLNLVESYSFEKIGEGHWKNGDFDVGLIQLHFDTAQPIPIIVIQTSGRILALTNDPLKNLLRAIRDLLQPVKIFDVCFKPIDLDELLG